jgi:hypothetical protein
MATTRQAFHPSEHPFNLPNGLVNDVNLAYVRSRQNPMVFPSKAHHHVGTTLLLQVLIRAFHSPRPTIVLSLPAPQWVTTTLRDARTHHVPCANGLPSTSSAHAPEAVS